MSEMIERAAKAILAKVPVGYGMTKPEAEMYARAVFESALEPTEAICNVGAYLMPDYDPSATDACEVWQAMIASILK